MLTTEIAQKIKCAADSSDRQNWTAELHLQIIKYSQELKSTSGKDFCRLVGIQPSYATEFAKMKKIAGRLIQAGLDVNKI